MRYDEFNDKCDEFIRIKRARSDKTAKAYDVSLRYLRGYLFNEIHVDDINDNNSNQLIQGYQAWLINGFRFNGRDIKLSSSSVNTHMRRAKTFLNYIGFKDVKIKPLHIDKLEPKAMDINDIKLMIAEAPNVFKDEIALRTQTLIKFLFNTALRIDEALNLSIDDIDVTGDKYYIYIQAKGYAKDSKSKIAISDDTYEMLMDYFDKMGIKSHYIFSSSHNGDTIKPISRNIFNRDIKKLAEAVDSKYYPGENKLSKIVSNNSSHFLRHSRAKYLLDNNVNISEVKDVLRHKSINNTMIYLSNDEDKIDDIRINNDI